MFAVSELAIF